MGRFSFFFPEHHWRGKAGEGGAHHSQACCGVVADSQRGRPHRLCSSATSTALGPHPALLHPPCSGGRGCTGWLPPSPGGPSRTAAKTKGRQAAQAGSTARQHGQAAAGGGAQRPAGHQPAQPDSQPGCAPGLRTAWQPQHVLSGTVCCFAALRIASPAPCAPSCCPSASAAPLLTCHDTRRGRLGQTAAWPPKVSKQRYRQSFPSQPPSWPAALPPPARCCLQHASWLCPTEGPPHLASLGQHRPIPAALDAEPAFSLPLSRHLICRKQGPGAGSRWAAVAQGKRGQCLGMAAGLLRNSRPRASRRARVQFRAQLPRRTCRHGGAVIAPAGGTLQPIRSGSVPGEVRGRGPAPKAVALIAYRAAKSITRTCKGCRARGRLPKRGFHSAAGQRGCEWALPPSDRRLPLLSPRIAASTARLLRLGPLSPPLPAVQPSCASGAHAVASSAQKLSEAEAGGVLQGLRALPGGCWCRDQGVHLTLGLLKATRSPGCSVRRSIQRSAVSCRHTSLFAWLCLPQT